MQNQALVAFQQVGRLHLFSMYHACPSLFNGMLFTACDFFYPMVSFQYTATSRKHIHLKHNPSQSDFAKYRHIILIDYQLSQDQIEWIKDKESIALGDCKFDYASFMRLMIGNQNMKQLRIWFSKQTKQKGFLANIFYLKNLERLQLNNLHLQDKHISVIQNLKLLQLNLNCNKLTSNSLKDLPNIQKLQILHIKHNLIKDVTLDQIIKGQELRQVNFFKNKIKWKDVNLKKLHWINLSDTTVLEETVNALSQIKTLHGLGLSNLYISPSCQFPQNLISLSIMQSNLSPTHCLRILNLKQLSSLNLNQNNIGDEGMQIISNMKSLKRLYVGHNQIGWKGAKFISKMNKLDCLHIGFNQIGNKGLCFLNNLTKIKILNIYRCNLDPQPFHLQFPKLIQLQIGHNNNLYKCCQNISLLHNLQFLHMQSSHINNDAVKLFTQITTLKLLNLNFNQVGDQGLKYISQMKNLYALIVNFNQLTDESIKYLSYSSIINLQLVGNQISTIGSQNIILLTRLQYLRISMNSINLNNIKQFKQKLTNLRKITIHQNFVFAIIDQINKIVQDKFYVQFK